MSSASSAAPTKSSSSMIVGMLLFAVLVGGGSVWYVQRHERTTEAGKPLESTSPPKYIIHLEGFTVNLADQEATHFLRATIDLGIDRLPEGADKEKASQWIPVARVRDAILSVLTVCKSDDLLTPEGKAQLKKNILTSLNKAAPEVGVREVYFTEFLVQR